LSAFFVADLSAFFVADLFAFFVADLFAFFVANWLIWIYWIQLRAKTYATPPRKNLKNKKTKRERFRTCSGFLGQFISL